jgi:protein TonB
MTSFRVFVLAISFLVLSPMGFATNKQAETGSLIERAKEVSDIRADGAVAFRLKLGFKLLKQDGSQLEGTYVEIWTSKDHWRRETVAGDFRRTEVAAGPKRFLLELVTALPEHIGDLPALTDIGTLQPEAWTPERIENRKLNGSSVRCIETTAVIRAGLHLAIAPEPKVWGDAPSLCFDRSSGVLAAEVEPATSRSEDEACLFSDYQKFGDRLYARSYNCLVGGQTRLGARVVELAMLPKVDPELFARPNGAKELSSCPDPVRPPRVVYQPQSVGEPHSGTVAISASIGIDGVPSALSVVSSSGPKREKAALAEVRQWRFRPATCDKEPVEMRITVEVRTNINRP